MVQFGDPQSKTLPMDDPNWAPAGPGYTIKAEFNKRKFERGMLGMARTNDPDSGGQPDLHHARPAHSPERQVHRLRKVASGMDVVDTIKVGDRMKSVKCQLLIKKETS